MRIPIPRASLLAVLALGGCQLFDTRPKVEILPAGLLVGCWTVDIVVKAADDPPEAEILIDGRVHGDPVWVNQQVSIDLRNVPSGMHTLAARIDGSTRRQSADSALLVCPPAPKLVSVQPPSGPVDPWTPLTADLAFSEAVADLTWTASGDLLGPLGAADVEVALSADRTGATVRLARPMVEYGSVYLALKLFGPHGNSNPAAVGWGLPSVTVTFQSPSADGTWVRGIVPIEATASVPLSQAELLVNGAPMASLGPPPWTFDWDSTTVASGSIARFSVRSPPWTLIGARSVNVDNVAPVLLGCQVRWAAQLGAHSCVDASFSDWITSLTVAGTMGGISWPSPLPTVPSPYSTPLLRVCLDGPYVPLPAEVAFTFSGTDRAGNPFPSPQACAFPLERWWRPWGDGPVSAASGELTGRPADVSGYLERDSQDYVWNRPHARLVLLGGLQDDGLARTAEGTTSEPFTLSDPLVAKPPAEFVAGGSAMAWVERGTGPGLVFASSPTNISSSPLNADLTHDAWRPALDGDVTAWSEETGVGGRAVRVAFRSTLIGGPLGSDPTGIADSPSVVGVGPHYDFFTPTGPAVAFVDAGPGAISTVRVAGWDGQAWIPFGDVLNVDPTRAAEEPVLLSAYPMEWVAFVEAGQVYARNWDSSAQAWGTPVALNTDPARIARSPRRCDSVIAFIEAGPSGDEIHVRRWNGSSWDLLPGPVNEGVPGTVTSFAVGGWKPVFVAWTDDAGLVRIRISNE